MTEVMFKGDVCHVSGNLTFKTATSVFNTVVAKFKSQTKLTFDLNKVEKVDSAALAVLCELLREANSKNTQLSFINAPKSLVNLASLCDVSEILSI